MNNTITLKAPAKINLFLDVTGVRNDGYHLIESVFQTISIFDIVTIKLNKTGVLTVSTNDITVPSNENNIAYKAAQKFLKYINDDKIGVDIYIEKNIPNQAGLGGGSSDAAAVLNGLNSLLNVNLSYDELCKIAVELGADVPFFIKGGTAFAKGVGEILTPLSPILKLHLVVAKGKGGISTAEAYKKIDNLYNSQHKKSETILQTIKSNDMIELPNHCFNIFEYVTELDDVFNIKKTMLKNNALCSVMSGSGSAVFGIFADKDSAYECSNLLSKLYEFSLPCTIDN
ncbi:MAG TPA: 4-(cytidine 5'-diphospho)-2-C-methyl-D-erythritol kinase [Clostridiales bacterium]|nr:4-(cytidine 5'-diphospho)-2-C-methyl-D-erythritol kinase [Clostridiales bacterium]